jgi:5-formyltetrahydrofolate cyclo-ligase
MPAQHHRKTLRTQLRAARRQLSASQQKQAAEGVSFQLSRYFSNDSHLKMGTYLANDGEVDLSLFVGSTQQIFSFSLPVLHPVCKGHLLFLEYASHTPLIQNMYGILEPELACQHIMPTHELDVILMPLVGFDNDGNRLGMGGGYYDRTLAYTRHAVKKPMLIGVAHDLQHVENLPHASWDIPLNAIVTPTRLHHFSL